MALFLRIWSGLTEGTESGCIDHCHTYVSRMSCTVSPTSPLTRGARFVDLANPPENRRVGDLRQLGQMSRCAMHSANAYIATSWC
eukprot:1636149-Amphidinium_carterae.2